MRKVAWKDSPEDTPAQSPENGGRHLAWKDPPEVPARKAEVPAQQAPARPVQEPAAPAKQAPVRPAQVPAAVPAREPAPVRELQEPAWVNGEPEHRERKVAWKDPVRKKARKPDRKAQEPEAGERKIAWKEPVQSPAKKNTDRNSTERKKAERKGGEKASAGKQNHGGKQKKPLTVKKKRQILLIAGILFGVIAIAGLSVFVKEWRIYRQGAVYYERLSAFIERDLEPPQTTAAGKEEGTETGDGSGTDAGDGTETGSGSAEAGSTGSRFGKVRGSHLDFTNLRRMNPDVAGWLSVPQISFSGPVVWCGNNTTYLDKAFDWTPSRNGCLFLAADAASDFSLPYQLIYGRNMHNGTMFGKLDRYRKKSFFEKHPTFLLYTPRQDYECAVFSCYRTEDASEVYRMDWKDAGEYAEFLERMKAASAYDTGVDVFPGDKVLTLSTCDSSYSGGKDRFVVHAIMRRIE